MPQVGVLADLCVSCRTGTGLLRKCGGQCPPYGRMRRVGRALPAVFVCRCAAHRQEFLRHQIPSHSSISERLRADKMFVGKAEGKPLTALQGKRVTVAGLGHFGGQVAVARWLVERGANVLVTDRAPAEKLADSLKQLEGLPIEFRLGEHRIDDFKNADLIVASPAVPPTNEYLAAARSVGVPITTEIRLLVERCPATVIGVTGTKGKSTTTAMLGKMLGQRFTTWVGGNIGGSLLPELEKIDKTHLVVLELSSYMLDYLGAMNWSPHVSLVTLIAADHLEWHGSHAAYVNAKANIVRYQRPDDVAVLNGEDPGARAMMSQTSARIVLYGLDRAKPFDLLLPGRHNQLNARAHSPPPRHWGSPLNMRRRRCAISPAFRIACNWCANTTAFNITTTRSRLSQSRRSPRWNHSHPSA